VSDFSVTRDEAKAGREYITGNTQYVLYRTEAGTHTLAPGLGAYNFALGQAQAQFSRSGVVTAATVQGGTLSIDFAARTFATQLNVTSTATGGVTISGAGAVSSAGVFSDRTTSGTVISGATALDGKSAGYLFQKSIGSGSLSGITLWSRP
jgi:hypothetical protein